ncbi:MAG: methylmalonyl-CoA mutase family protein, partial [Bryobacteraceae bacterium]
PQSEIANASYEYQKSVEAGQSIIVGVNGFTDRSEQPIETLEIGEATARRQEEKLAALRRRRSQTRVAEALDALRRAAEGRENTMPAILDAVRAYATVGEMCEAYRRVFGTFEERAVL